jgi:hypothetical protein
MSPSSSTPAPEAPRRTKGNARARGSVITLGLFILLAASARGQGPVFIKDYISSKEAGPSGIKVVKCWKEGVAEQRDERSCMAKIGYVLSLEVGNLAGWLEKLKSDKIITSGESGEALVVEQLPKLNLFIGEHFMRTLHPTEYTKDDPTWYAEGSEERKIAPARSWLEFILKRDAANKASRDDWDPVLRTPGYFPKMELAVGFFTSNGNVAHVMALPLGTDKADPQLEFHLQLLAWDGWTIGCVSLIGIAVAVFLYMLLRTGIVRDSTCVVRPDGLPPLSLGRCQMAFWFFLVITAFCFLWIITGRGDTDTINGTILTLIGISAGTGLGSAIVSKNEAPTAAAKDEAAKAAYPYKIKEAQKALEDANRAGDKDRVKVLESQVTEFEDALTKWRAENRNQLLLDLFSEESVSTDADRVITFHRFQIVVWTLVLGVVFVSEVMTKLAMPVFDATLLTLMGISSGTYLGFKVSK